MQFRKSEYNIYIYIANTLARVHKVQSKAYLRPCKKNYALLSPQKENHSALYLISINKPISIDFSLEFEFALDLNGTAIGSFYGYTLSFSIQCAVLTFIEI